MYSTARKIVVFGVIIGMMNAIGAILLLCCLPALGINFTLNFSIILYVITSFAVLILLVFGVRSLCQDLDLNYEKDNLRFRDLQKKIDALEAQIKQ